ncbi:MULTISPECIES: hypothetical protein [unclassified Roseitalea]|uniref:hypothetical protein n=1 Tax=unclassified Roseitalea TaxID=2639107 RepID=UPI00273D7651|nr:MULTISPECIES: hypothetical protein [unclassified Roseitalea]
MKHTRTYRPIQPFCALCGHAAHCRAAGGNPANCPYREEFETNDKRRRAITRKRMISRETL